MSLCESGFGLPRLPQSREDSGKLEPRTIGSWLLCKKVTQRLDCSTKVAKRFQNCSKSEACLGSKLWMTVLRQCSENAGSFLLFSARIQRVGECEQMRGVRLDTAGDLHAGSLRSRLRDRKSCACDLGEHQENRSASAA